MKGGVTPSLLSTGGAVNGAVGAAGVATGGGGVAGPTGAPVVVHAASSRTAAAVARRIHLCARWPSAVHALLLMERPSNSRPKAADLRGRAKTSPSLEPGLYVVSTPIGNLRDVTLRALEVLACADIVLAEDTRVTRTLLKAHAIEARLTSYHEHNEEALRPKILAALDAGQSVALVSDAGTPLVSDPGFKLARAALDAGRRVIPVPGPAALLAALVASGLPSDRFLFAGFAPTKTSARRSFFREFAAVPATLIFYETGPRLKASLDAMADVFGDRDAAVARELTKFFEEVRRGPLRTLAAETALAPKGELVVLVAPPSRDRAQPAESDVDAALRDALAHHSVREASDLVSTELGLPRREVYARALRLKDEA